LAGLARQSRPGLGSSWRDEMKDHRARDTDAKCDQCAVARIRPSTSRDQDQRGRADKFESIYRHTLKYALGIALLPVRPAAIIKVTHSPTRRTRTRAGRIFALHHLFV